MRTHRPLDPTTCAALVTTTRWLSKVSIPPEEGGCWLWTGALLPGGYGSISLSGSRQVGAHRVALVASLGRDLLPGMQAGHLCHDWAVTAGGCEPPCQHRRCVNPVHLAEQTPSENFLGAGGNQNSRKTHCQNGHPLTGDNLIVSIKGYRQCRTCRDAYNASRPSQSQGKSNREKTHCKRGHPLDGDNLIITARGRVCRACRDAYNRAYYEARKEV